MDRANITIYTTPTCYFCHAMMEWLEKNQVSFEEVDVSDPANRAIAEEQLGHPVTAVPVALFYGEEVVGFDRRAIKRILKAHAE